MWSVLLRGGQEQWDGRVLGGALLLDTLLLDTLIMRVGLVGGLAAHQTPDPWRGLAQDGNLDGWSPGCVAACPEACCPDFCSETGCLAVPKLAALILPLQLPTPKLPATALPETV